MRVRELSKKIKLRLELLATILSPQGESLPENRTITEEKWRERDQGRIYILNPLFLAEINVLGCFYL